MNFLLYCKTKDNQPYKSLSIIENTKRKEYYKEGGGLEREKVIAIKKNKICYIRYLLVKMDIYSTLRRFANAKLSG